MKNTQYLKLGPIKRKQSKVYGLVATCFWLMVWEVACRWIDNTILMVSPVQVFFTLMDMMKTVEFYHELFTTLARILGGFFSGFFLGISFATLAYKYEIVSYLLKPIVSVIKSTPVAAFIILVLIWVGSSYLVVVIALLMVFPVIYSNIYQGYCQVQPEMIEMSAIFRLSFRRKIRYIYLPSLIPYLTVGSTLSLGLCFKAGIAAEVIGIPAGSIGASLYNAKLYLDINTVFAWTIVIIVCSVCLERLALFMIRKGYEHLGGNLNNDRIKKGM